MLGAMARTAGQGWAVDDWRGALPYVVLLGTLTLLLWLALVARFPAPPPAADGHDDLNGQRPAAPLVSPVAPWWRGDAAGVVGAYAAGGVGLLVGLVRGPLWRRSATNRPPRPAPAPPSPPAPPPPGRVGQPRAPRRGDPLGVALVGLVVFLGAYVALVIVEQLLGLDLWLLAFALALAGAIVAALRQLRGGDDR